MTADDNGSRPKYEGPDLTIVGGRPGEDIVPPAQVPMNIQVLIAKAGMDVEFREALLCERAEAAKRVGLELTPVEAGILSALPEEQLALMIGSTAGVLTRALGLF